LRSYGFTTIGEHMSLRRLLGIPLTLALVAALALGAAACGDDDDDEAEAAARRAAPAELTLTGESTSLTLDAATAGVLEDNGVAVAPVAPARVEAGAIAFPITRGQRRGREPRRDHRARRRLGLLGRRDQARGHRLRHRHRRRDADGDHQGDQVPLLNVELTGLQRSEDAGAIVLEGITTTLTGEAATALNEAFQVTIFEEGLAIGDVVVRATAG
jgi:hypothetical protein